MSALVGTTAFAEAAAEGPASQGGTVEEIVVTANKQEQNLQKVSTVVSAISAKTLEERHVTDVRGLQNITPSLKLTPNGTATTIFIRGVGTQNNATGSDPAVSVNVDGINMYRYALAGTLYDLQRVEVVYGPQGTLYGRNSTAGVINFITQRPGDDYGGYVTADIGNYGLLRGTAAADIPVSDTLKLRVAINGIQRNGYFRTGQAGDTGLGGESNFSGRFSALWTPTPNLSVLGKFEYWHGGGSSQLAANYPYIKPDNPWYTPITRAQWGTWNDSRFYLASAQIDWNLGDGWAINYTPGWLDNEANYTLANGGADAFVTTSIPKTFVRRYYLPWREFSNELRLTKTTDRLHWMLGLYQYYGDSNSDPGLAANTFPGIEGVPIARISRSGYDHTTERAYGVFSQGTYNVTDSFRVILGGRYSYDPKFEDFNLGSVFTSGKFTASGHDETVPGGVHIVARETSKHFDYKVGAEYDLAPDIMVYANIATGFLDGGLITQPAVGLSPYFDPEYLTQYAVGMKGQFFDRHLTLNGELFYYDYKGLQIVTNVQNPLTGLGVSGVVNADKVRIEGADISATLHLDDGTTLDAKAGLLPTAEIVKLQTLSGNFAGYRMPYAANTTFSVGIQHIWELGNGGAIKARADSSISSGYWETFDHKPNTFQKNYTRTDLSIGYQPADAKWSIAGWIKNLENGAQLTSAGGDGTAIIAPPRTFGTTISVNF